MYVILHNITISLNGHYLLVCMSGTLGMYARFRHSKTKAHCMVHCNTVNPKCSFVNVNLFTLTMTKFRIYHRGRKFGREINLAIWQFMPTTAWLKSANIFLSLVTHTRIYTYDHTAKFRSANISISAAQDQPAKFKDHQYFQLDMVLSNGIVLWQATAVFHHLLYNISLLSTCRL